MMVNEVNNSPGSWQSTIPQQMPWMSSYGPTSLTTQFGQQSASEIQHEHVHQSAQTPTELPFIQNQHLSMANFLTATTLTLPITVCPTSSTVNCQYGLTNSMPSNCVTTTTYSYPPMHNPAQTLQPSSASTYNLPNPNLPCYTQADIYDPTISLTQLVQVTEPSMDMISNHKRRSIEMEDDQVKTDEPPTKQLLSELKLFKQFGSLQIDKLSSESSLGQNREEDIDDSEEDEQYQSACNKCDVNEREDFNRYVYLLFKDKKNDGKPFTAAYSSLDRLAREESDKLRKAVVLWNPPVRNFLNQSNDDDGEDDDEEFTYTDHKDFLKKTDVTNEEPGVIISEITTDELDIDSTQDDAMCSLDPEDVMLE